MKILPVFLFHSSLRASFTIWKGLNANFYYVIWGPQISRLHIRYKSDKSYLWPYYPRWARCASWTVGAAHSIFCLRKKMNARRTMSGSRMMRMRCGVSGEAGKGWEVWRTVNPRLEILILKSWKKKKQFVSLLLSDFLLSMGFLKCGMIKCGLKFVAYSIKSVYKERTQICVREHGFPQLLIVNLCPWTHMCIPRTQILWNWPQVASLARQFLNSWMGTALAKD